MAERNGLKRIAEVYALVERMRALELGMAAGALAEVDRARAFEEGFRREQALAGQAALVSGDRAEWSLVEVQREAAKVRAQRLEEVRVEREAVRQEALATHRESRMNLQQMETAIERRRSQVQVETDRRTQAGSDDRFLSRRDWVRRSDDRRGSGGPADG